jgi:zinc transport system substrate-binding protein
MKNVLLLISCAFILFACGRTSNDKNQRRPVITVTIEPQRYFTEAIGGSFCDVSCIVPRGNSPETYDPVPRQLVELGKSTAYLRIGFIGFERMWMNRLISNAPQMKIYTTYQGIDLIRHSETGASSNRPELVEPHIWCSLVNARVIAKNTAKILSTLDRNHAQIYYSRCDSLLKIIKRLDSTIRYKLSTSAGKAFAIYHPSLSYFARDYGLRQIVIEEEGKEPSPSELVRIIKECKASNVHVIFVQPEFDIRNAEIIAKQIGARVVRINPLNKDWDTEMLNIANALSEQTK